MPGDAIPEERSTPKVNKHHCSEIAVPSDSESADTEVVWEEELDESDQSPSGEESIDDLPPATSKSLQAEAHSLYHMLTHKLKSPFCEACRRAKMKEQRQYVGSYRNTTNRCGSWSLGTTSYVHNTICWGSMEAQTC